MDARKELEKCRRREKALEKLFETAREALEATREMGVILERLVDEEARRGAAGEVREAKRDHAAKVQGRGQKVKRKGGAK